MQIALCDLHNVNRIMMAPGLRSGHVSVHVCRNLFGAEFIIIMEIIDFTDILFPRYIL